MFGQSVGAGDVRSPESVRPGVANASFRSHFLVILGSPEWWGKGQKEAGAWACRWWQEGAVRSLEMVAVVLFLETMDVEGARVCYSGVEEDAYGFEGWVTDVLFILVNCLGVEIKYWMFTEGDGFVHSNQWRSVVYWSCSLDYRKGGAFLWQFISVFCKNWS